MLESGSTSQRSLRERRGQAGPSLAQLLLREVRMPVPWRGRGGNEAKSSAFPELENKKKNRILWQSWQLELGVRVLERGMICR